jgi:hypothetical protein
MKIPKKPMRPLTSYHIFFQIERAYILQTLPDATEEDDSRSSTKTFLENVPQRYKAIKLSPDWYFGPGKRPKRKHRKAHGKIGFQELSRIIASRWAQLDTLDPEVKAFVSKIAKEELDEYLADMKEYKELMKSLSAKPVVSANSSVAPSPSSSPEPSAKSHSNRCSDSKKRSCPLNQPTRRWLPEAHVSMMQDTYQPYHGMDLSNEIDDFIYRIDSDARSLLPERHLAANTYTAVTDTAYYTCQERRNSLLAYLEPLFDNLEQDSVIHEQPEQFTQQPQLQEQPSKKQRRHSPASVVDICDNEIIRMWKEKNAV